ncbi:MAG TPA: SCO family protein [Vicinamibacterales bacterium]|jgi:protein SCO1/2
MKISAVSLKALALLIFFSVVLTAPIDAQGIPGQTGPADVGPAAGAMPAMLKGITIQQKLNSQIPLDLHFHDEAGRDVTLRQYFADRPVILNLVYFRCAMLCPQVVAGLARSLKQLTFEVGKQYTVLTVSFDPADTPNVAAEKKAIALKQLGQSGAANGWHFLTGDESSIRRLTDAVGFVYRWDPATQQFFHAAGIMLLTPEGKLSRYFYGIDFTSTDLRLGLVEASHDHIGSAVDAVLLFCCRYDASTGKYDWLAGRLLSLAGLLTLVILGTFLVILARSEPGQPKTS